MKTRLALSLAALSLALVSCSNPANSDTPQPDLSTLAAPTTTSAAPKEPTKVEIGETITLTHGEEESQEVDLTIADIDASRQCHNGQSTSIDVPEESGYYVQMTGEVEAKKLQDTYRFSFADLTAKTSDGDEIDIEAADGCENAHEAFEGYQDLSNEVSASASVQGVLEFWVSDLPQTLTYSPVDEPNIFVWSVPEFVETSTEQSAPTLSQEATPAAADDEPYVVECLFGTPGPALWSDGTTAYSDYCFYANGGPEYLEAESQSGLPPSSAWDGFDPEPYRSDGCVGSAAVCGYYDDNGDPIWFDKTTLESSPRYYDEFGNPTMDPEKGTVRTTE